MWPFSSSYPELTCQSLAEEYDYIIIGGGTAGCALANRLSSDPSVSVLLVERGLAADTWASRVPLFSTDFASDGSRTYKRDSLPQKFVDGRTQQLYSGKVLGGTSRINSMLYTRGIAAEYNAWSAAGRKGWSYDDVLPLFKKGERNLDNAAGPERGRDGEWTTRSHDITYFPTTTRVFEAGKKLGLPSIGDMNSSSSPALGFGKAQFTINQNGYRNSSFAAFLPLKLVLSRKSHLAICTGTIATKIDIAPGSDSEGIPRAKGVYLQSAFSTSRTSYVSVKREVILCSGPFGNPQLLQLSGVGPQDHLKSLGIPVMKDLPGVGSHFQDHLAVPIVFQVPMEDSLLSIEKRFFTFMREFVKYMTRGTGLLLSPVLESGIFVKSDLLDAESNLHASALQLNARDPANIPDIEIIPIAYDGTGVPFDKSHGVFGFLNVLLRPQSTGTIRLASSNPNDPLQCELGTLAAPEDWKVLRASLRLSLALAKQMRKDGYPMTDYRVPASDSDADLDAYIKKWVRTTYHYSSSCRMAPENDPAPGVVDDDLRVHGVRSLRVADSSIFPQILATHLQAPSVMVGEKCAELLNGGH
ncbi:alcohol oxidase [Phellopilus nigrolimitatus]|nr:alcohol oxidase [Phellopilus nigrolimitatus]